MAISKIASAGITADFDNSLTTADLAPNSVDSSELVDGSVDLSHMSANSVDSDQYVDGSIDTAHLANNIAISTSGAITTTGAFTSVGIDDNADALAMTIDSSENIGLGTASPTGSGWDNNSRLLHIYQNATAGSLIKLESSNTTGFMVSGDEHFCLGTTTNDPVKFYQNGSLKYQIIDGGHLVLGGTATQKIGFWYQGHSSTGNTTGSHTFGLSSHRLWATFTSGGNKRADVVMFNGRLNPGSWTGQGIAIGHTTPALFSGSTTVADANNTYSVTVSGGVNQLTFGRSSGSTDWDLHIKYMHNSK